MIPFRRPPGAQAHPARSREEVALDNFVNALRDAVLKSGGTWNDSESRPMIRGIAESVANELQPKAKR